MIARRRSPSRPPRRGAVLALALACLLAVMLFGAAMVRQSLIDMRESRRARQTLQAKWLAQAGFDRSRAALFSDPTYPGESWRPDPAAFSNGEQALVEIAVVEVASPPEAQATDTRMIRVTAHFGRSLESGAVVQDERLVELPLSKAP